MNKELKQQVDKLLLGEHLSGCATHFDRLSAEGFDSRSPATPRPESTVERRVSIREKFEDDGFVRRHDSPRYERRRRPFHRRFFR
jgi:hypothetical protein